MRPANDRILKQPTGVGYYEPPSLEKFLRNRYRPSSPVLYESWGESFRGFFCENIPAAFRTLKEGTGYFFNAADSVFNATLSVANWGVYVGLLFGAIMLPFALMSAYGLAGLVAAIFVCPRMNKLVEESKPV